MKAEEARQIAAARIAADARRWRKGMVVAVALAVAALAVALLVDAAGLAVGLAAGWIVGMVMGAFGATARRSALEAGAGGLSLADWEAARTLPPAAGVGNFPPPAAPLDSTPWRDLRPESRRGSQEVAFFDRERHELLTPEQWRARQAAGDD